MEDNNHMFFLNLMEEKMFFYGGAWGINLEMVKIMLRYILLNLHVSFALYSKFN